MTVECTNIPNLSNIGLNSTLQNLTLEENVASIASGAFNSYSFLQNVTCLATTPPTLEDNTVFPYPNIASLTIPCGTLEAYSSATSFWNMFFAGRISENGYNVEVSVNDETFGSVAVESDCSTGTLTATANEGYRFVIWNDGNTDNPRTVTLTSDTAFTAIFAAIDESSLSEDAEVAKIGVYPNPTSGKVVFDKAVERVEVIDLVGKTIQTYENASEINIGALPAGVYHLRISLEDQTITRMVIKE
ncbi:MAG: T9SS type A sorting domain-containing protein [Bacteroidales bacterium]|nr:T9SS type A sorting domain-containing protein [Bacteroidales bacterium]